MENPNGESKSTSTTLPSDEKDNGSILGKRPIESTEDISTKKVKVEGKLISPTKVLHVRNIPSDCTEQELSQLGKPFGTVQSVLLLKGKNQAFIQFSSPKEAVDLVEYYSGGTQANLRGKPIHFEYSSRESITPESPNQVLLVTVSNLLYPVTIDALHTVFSKYGMVTKIVMFQKSGAFQALIQFQNATEASEAKANLDGKHIYTGCCTLAVQFSQVQDLNVRYNTDKTRDYTNPSLPTKPPAAPTAPVTPYAPPTAPSSMKPPVLPYTPVNPYEPPAWNGYPPAPYNPYAPPTGVPVPHSSGPTVLIISNLDPNRITPAFGDVLRVKILYNKRDTALIEFTNSHHAAIAAEHLNSVPLHGKHLLVNFSKHTTITLPKNVTDQESINLVKDYTGSPLHRYRVSGSKNLQHICTPNVSLHVSNIPSTVNDQALASLFGKYGTVVGVSFFPIIQGDKRMALVQMGTPAEAVEALINLHNYKIDSANIRVSFSKKAKAS